MMATDNHKRDMGKKRAYMRAYMTEKYKTPAGKKRHAVAMKARYAAIAAGRAHRNDGTEVHHTTAVAKGGGGGKTVVVKKSSHRGDAAHAPQGARAGKASAKNAQKSKAALAGRRAVGKS
jgi:hypothetical protein